MSGSSYDPYNPLSIQNIADSLVRELLEQDCLPLRPSTRFNGAGVYLIYYLGSFPPYTPIARRNQSSCDVPIYIGKAVPKGGRKGINIENGAQSSALYSRLSQHATSIEAATNLGLDDFKCRYRVIEELFIELAERTLIQRYKPLWNAELDGFGNRDPGKVRYTGKRPAWDEVHPGRKWAAFLTPGPNTAEQLLTKVSSYLAAWERGTLEEIAILDDANDEEDDER